jgi:hypothetical protein
MKKILITTLFLLSAPSFATAINVQALEACSLVENDLKRLMCYDKVIKTKKQELEKSPISNQQTKEVKPKQADDVFGLENQVKKEIDEISSSIVELKLPKIGSRTITLENGQIWKLTDTDSFKAKVGDTVVVKRAFLGSFLMKTENSNKSYRVKRLK